MVEFQTINAEEIKFGRNNFLEIARKKAIAEEGENEFIAISRGFFLPDGQKRFKKSLAIPDENEIIEFVSTKIKEFSKAPDVSEKAIEEAEKEPQEEPAEEPETEEKPAEEKKK